MNEAEKKKKLANIKDYLTNLIIDFMYIVANKHDYESDEAHEKRVNANFKVNNCKWHLKCHEEKNEFLLLKQTAFSEGVQLIAKDGMKGQVAGVNAPLRKIDKKQEAKLIKLIN